MSKDQTKGRVEETKDKGSEVASKAVGNEKLTAKGKSPNTEGKAQASAGNSKEERKDAGKG